ncbi:MAG TPA: alpha/beta hydrolase [Conexibacter sp.]
MSLAESQLTTPVQTIDAPNGVTYAYRRYGNEAADAAPLVLLQHYRGSLDNWDPALVDALAATREVILVANAGVGRSTGTTPRDVTTMAYDALAFIDALGLAEIDLLGFSLGGFVAQELALIRPQQVRRLVLAGSAPQGGIGIHPIADAPRAVMTAAQPTAEGLIYLFFEQSETSTAAGQAFVQRIFTRQEDRDADVTAATYEAQMDAIAQWGAPDPTRLARLAAIRQPVLAANGVNDIIIPTPNTHLLATYIPNAELEIYPDAGHGFLFQYHEQFAARVVRFLDA